MEFMDGLHELRFALAHRKRDRADSLVNTVAVERLHTSPLQRWAEDRYTHRKVHLVDERHRRGSLAYL